VELEVPFPALNKILFSGYHNQTSMSISVLSNLKLKKTTKNISLHFLSIQTTAGIL